MEYFKLELDGHHFNESYLVYIIEIENPGYGRYFYIGQTGDRNHFTARPAFRRLSGHLSDQGSSTENQLYRSIVGKILKLQDIPRGAFETVIKQKASGFLKASRISMHIFPLKEFDTGASQETHSLNRKFVESVENHVLSSLVNRFGKDQILNKNPPKPNLQYGEDVLQISKEIIIRACPVNELIT